MAARKRIGVHSGKFHADDTLAIYLLLQTHEFFGSEIVRTRDPAVLAECDCLVDVGGEYDHDRRRYDHHQTSCTEQFPQSPVPMASWGRVVPPNGPAGVKKKKRRDDVVLYWGGGA